MTYSDFINSLGYGVSLFINTLTSFANNLINNYFVITMIGLAIFVSVFSLVIGLLPFDNGNKKSDDIDYK